MGNELLRSCAYVPKGGVGKTTSTAHIAVSAAQDHGLEVLVIDLAGTQNDLATQFGIAEQVADPDAPLSAIFGENWSFIRENIDDVFDRMVFETPEGPDLIPADDGLGAEDNNLANVPREDRYDRLETFIESEVAPNYDLVLLDLPGKEDNITINGLFAAENVIAPLKPGEFERKQLGNLERELARIREDDDHDARPQLRLVCATMIDGRTNLSSEFAEEIEAEYPEIASSPIADTANVGDGQERGQSLFAFADDDLYTSGVRAREAYRQLTTDLLERIEPR